jgi:hypothetical protein
LCTNVDQLKAKSNALGPFLAEQRVVI